MHYVLCIKNIVIFKMCRVRNPQHLVHRSSGNVGHELVDLVEWYWWNGLVGMARWNGTFVERYWWNGIGGMARW